jgi:porin
MSVFKTRCRSLLILALVSVPALIQPAAACEADAGEDCPTFSLEGGYTADFWRNTRGGIATGGSYLDAVDVLATLDAGRAFGWQGVTLHGHIQYNNGAAFSGRWVGDTQAVTNIEGVDTLRLYELWAEFDFGSAQAATLRVGFYDLNSEFDSIDTAGLFINSSHGIGPEFAQSGANGPSIFPVTTLALRLRGAAGAWYWQAAALDGAPGDRDDPERSGLYLSSGEGALLVGEIGREAGPLRKLAVGAWTYTAEFDALAELDGSTGGPLRRRGNSGVYALADANVWSRGERKIDAYVRLGAAADRFNSVARYAGAGLVVSGFSDSRPDDQWGVSIASARLGQDLRRSADMAGAPIDRHETTVEMTYRAPLTDWLTLQPDLQYVFNPGADRSLDDALVIGLRVEISGAMNR